MRTRAVVALLHCLALSFLVLSASLAQSRVTRRAGSTAQPNPAIRSAPTAITSLPLRRVVLYSNGVAWFERRGSVTGSAEINLSFKQSQVDDVLKSMVVLDLGRGRIGSVSYNSSASPEARLGEIPFSIEAGTKEDEAGGIAGVLKQLQGARVVVATASRAVTGAILNIADRRAQIDANKPPLVTQHLVIAAEGGELQSFDLADVRSVKLLDEEARHDLTEFAAAAASSRRRDAKTITVTSEGEGTRDMVISYTIAAPIWKTTYRVVLDPDGKPFFQGWAIVDNASEEDWTNIRLSLVSGTPVSFIQPIQQPLFRYRPVIPIPEDLNLTPQTYEPAQGRAGGTGTGRGMNAGGGSASLGGGIGSGSGGGTGIATTLPGPVTTLSDAIIGEASGVTAAAAGNQTGDLFEYRIDQPVTVLRNRSALIPILQTRMEGERVSIYREAARADRPMSGLLLKNTSPLTLESGALTVLDGDAYAGEALIERLKPGEERFISFAVDLGTLISARSPETNKRTERKTAFLVRIVNGVFQAHYYRTERKVYTLTNQTERRRVVYLEHPAREGWMLSPDTQKPAARTDKYYRFRIELGPHATIELPVTEAQALMDSYALSRLTSADIELFAASNYIDAAVRVDLEKLTDLKARLAATEARIATANLEAAEIGKDQQRLRENIDKLKGTTEARQLIARYVSKAGQQESRLEQLVTEKRAAEAERAKLQAELEAAIRVFALERRP